MRSLAALVVIVLAALPALFAGVPGTEPAWLYGSLGGVPMSVVFMCVLMAVFVVLAAICSNAAKGHQLHGEDK